MRAGSRNFWRTSNAKVNLIALNPGPGIPFETPSRNASRRFQTIVRRSVPVLHPQAARPGCLRRVRTVEANGNGRADTDWFLNSTAASPLREEKRFQSQNLATFEKTFRVTWGESWI